MVEISLPEKAERLFEPWRYKIIYGGRGGAKSWTVARILTARGANEKLRILCGREFQTSIRESVHKLLCDQIAAQGLDGYYRIDQKTISSVTGSEIIFEGLKHNSTKIKSLEGVDICWLEQAETLSQSSLDDVVPTIRKDGSEIWMTINPELEDDPVYQQYILNPPDDALLLEMGWRDNPWFPEVLKKEKDRMARERPDDYLHIYEGKTKAALTGAIYAEQLRKATADRRITRVPFTPGIPVQTFWDLGHSDQTAIWFMQRVGLENYFIDFYSNAGFRLDHYLSLLQSKGFLYGRHFLPHDAENTVLQGRSVADQMRDLYGRQAVVVVPRTNNVAMDIEVVRNVFDLCWFDRERCVDGLHALRHYRYGVDDKTGRRSSLPLHDWTSDAADAFRTFGVGFRNPPPKRAQPNPVGTVQTPPSGPSQSWMGS